MKVTDIPDRIYIQWYGEGHPDEFNADFELPCDEITWCKDKIFDHDIEYVRVEKGGEDGQ